MMNDPIRDVVSYLVSISGTRAALSPSVTPLDATVAARTLSECAYESVERSAGAQYGRALVHIEAAIDALDTASVVIATGE